MIFIKTISEVFAHASYKCPVNSCLEWAWIITGHAKTITDQLDGHLKHFGFASPDRLFFWTKKSENSNITVFENFRIMSREKAVTNRIIHWCIINSRYYSHFYICYDISNISSLLQKFHLAIKAMLHSLQTQKNLELVFRPQFLYNFLMKFFLL